VNCVFLCIFCVYICRVLLPPGGYPIAVNKYIIPNFIIISQLLHITQQVLSIWHRYWTVRGLNPSRSDRFFSSPETSRWARGPPPPILLFEYRNFFTRVKRQGREANHSHPYIAEVKNRWSYSSVLLISLNGVDTEKFTFNFHLYYCISRGEF